MWDAHNKTHIWASSPHNHKPGRIARQRLDVCGHSFSQVPVNWNTNCIKIFCPSSLLPRLFLSGQGNEHWTVEWRGRVTRYWYWSAFLPCLTKSELIRSFLVSQPRCNHMQNISFMGRASFKPYNRGWTLLYWLTCGVTIPVKHGVRAKVLI